MNSRLLALVLAICSVGTLHARSVLAEGDDESDVDSEEEAHQEQSDSDAASEEDSGEEDSDEEKDDEDSTTTEGEDEEEAASGSSRDSSPVEARGRSYQFIGARWRMQVVPKFIQNAFGSEGGRTVASQGVGAEASTRRDDFEMVFSLWWAEYHLEDTLYKGRGEDDTELEVINSGLSVLYGTADFLWSAPVSTTFAFNYGAGLGVGVVLGELTRTEAYPDVNGSLEGPNGGRFSKCLGPGNPTLPPPGGDQWCDAGGSYGPEPTWFGGGSTPALFPWFALNTGVRYKPHRHFALRADLGFAIPALFFFGVGAQYGL